MGVYWIILITIAATVLILLILALFIPKHYSVTVSAIINRPRKIVFDYVRVLENQLDYSEWYKPGGKKVPTSLTGTDGTIGAIMKWDSDNKDLGSGEQEIKSMDEGHIGIELRFIQPIAGTCKLNNYFEPVGETVTQYTCSFHAYAKFPINLPAVLFGKRFIRKAQQKTLNNIKEILEKQ